MRKKIFSNWGLKLASLLLAFGLWLIVVYIEDPIDTVRFTNVPVMLLNTDILTDDGKIYEILDGTGTIRTVTVKGPKSVVDQITAADIAATADINELTLMSTVEIRFSLPSQYSSYEIIRSHEILKMNVEEQKEKYVNIKVVESGEVAEGYELESVTLDQNRIHISGPESKVLQVSYARVEVNVKDITSNSRTKEYIGLYDVEDNLVEYSSITRSMETVGVDATVYATKTVPISYSIMGEPADGYLQTGVVDISTGTVTIAGYQSVLNGISRITVPRDELDISGQTDNFIHVIDIEEHLPSGVRLAHNGFSGKVTVTVYIEPVVTKRLNILKDNIRIINIPEGFEADIADEAEAYELEVRGLEAQVSQLQGELMQGTVDVEAWLAESGREPASATYYITADFDITEDITVSRGVEVRILLTRPEEAE